MIPSPSPIEEDSSYVKDKAAKIAFLEKIISFVQSELNSPVHAQPKRIVSGLEPEKTCHFLQMLVVAATSHKQQERAETKDIDDEIKSLDEMPVAAEGSEKSNNETGNANRSDLISEILRVVTQRQRCGNEHHWLTYWSVGSSD